MTISKRLIYIFTYARAALAFLLLPVWTLLISTCVIVTGAFRFWNLQTWFMWLWCKGVLGYFGVRVIAKGFDNIPETGGGILTFNHQSHFDIPALTGSTLKCIRYGAKIELFRIPVFGQAVAASGCLKVARDKRSEVMKIYKESAKRFKEGFYYALAPEGTRQLLPEIGRFKKGPFIFAASSGVPVIPVVIEGADRVLAKGRLLANLGRLSRTIQIECLPPISASLLPEVIGEDLPNSVAIELLEKTQAVIVAKFIELRAQASNWYLDRS